MDSHELKTLIEQGSLKALAKGITAVENQTATGRELLTLLQPKNHIPVIGFTGPPGAGKSTLIAAFTELLLNQKLKVGILAVDPTSPFNKGSLLGDRIRMSQHFLHPDVYIRSLATRGSLGGLSPRAFEVIHLMQASGFDYILIETVGVGQSEVEIAGLADTTVLVLVPEAGDDVQTIKSGIMEIADIFVVNKADRDGADHFMKNLHALLHERTADDWSSPIIKTIASQQKGVQELLEATQQHQHYLLNSTDGNSRKIHILLEKALSIIKDERIRDLDVNSIYEALKLQSHREGFNLFQFVRKYI